MDMENSKKTKINGGLMEALSDDAVAKTAGGMAVVDTGYVDDAKDGIGYFKYYVSYTNADEKKAAASALNSLRPGGGDVLPRGNNFSGTIGIGNYCGGEYHNTKIIDGAIGVENRPLKGAKGKG